MKNPRLLLPEVLYALPGYELSIYFQNVVTTVDPASFAFEVKCEKGRCDSQRWRWTPEEKDTGTHSLTLSVWTGEGLAAESSCQIIVSPRDAGKNRSLTILQIGASCMAAAGHGDHLWSRFREPDNPHLTMLGSHGPGYKQKTADGPANEAYGGWSWSTFFTKECSDELDNDGLHPKRPYDVRSPFLFRRNGKDEFDFSAYLDTVCEGKRPQVIYFELGVNNVFMAKSDEELHCIWEEKLFPYMKRMFEEAKKAVPDALFAMELIPRGNWSQDAFGSNYACSQTRRRWLLNYEFLTKKYMQYAPVFPYFLIPEYPGMEGDVNYPKTEEGVYGECMQKVSRASNALHPTPEGYKQWADSEYFFLKYLLANHIK